MNLFADFGILKEIQGRQAAMDLEVRSRFLCRDGSLVYILKDNDNRPYHCGGDLQLMLRDGCDSSEWMPGGVDAVFRLYLHTPDGDVPLYEFQCGGAMPLQGARQHAAR